MPVGVFDQELFAQFRRAKGEQRRLLLNRLVVENAPLAKTIMGQLRGGEDTKPGRHRHMGGCAGFREIDLDDAYQAALVALARALEGFDPKKGKFSSYVKLWVRHELQRIVYGGGGESLVRVPRGAGVDAIPVALTDDQGELDRLSGGEEDRAIAQLEGGGDFDPGDAALVEWDPASLVGANDVRPPKPDVSGLELFLTNRVVLARHARVETWTAHNVYRIECRRVGRGEMPRPAFVAEMVRLTGVREVLIRTPLSSASRALAGMRLCT